MNDGGLGPGEEEVHQGKDIRARQSEIKERLKSPIGSKEDLYDLILSPLDLLQIVPDDVPPYLAKHAVWRDASDQDRRRAQSGIAWISDVQKLLLEKVMVDWKDELHGIPWFLEAWFAPRPQLPSLSLISSDDSSAAKYGSIFIATLSTLSSILSSASLAHNEAASSSQSTPLDLALPAETVSLMKKVLVLFTTNFSLTCVAESLQMYHTQAKKTLLWNSIIRELTSLPERVANATKGTGPDELQRKTFVRVLSEQIERMVHSTCPADLTATLLSKLVRSGYFEETASEREEPINFWPTFIRSTIARDSSHKEEGWSQALQKVPPSARTSIGLSLVSFVDKFSLQRGQFSLLVYDEEFGRAGSEGKRFLDLKTWTTALHIANVMGPLLATPDTEQEESDSDTDVEGQVRSSLISQLLHPSSTGYWSPLMARLLLHLLCRQATEKVLTRMLVKMIEIWSLSSRIKSAIWEQEVYLTTVVLLLIAQVSSTSTASLCTSSSFIAGVSAHLQHLSPRVRRLGMLVAETVSTGSGESQKSLSFGRSIWDGKGEGKEEARVLRAMYHGWTSREKDLGDKGDVATKLLAFGLSSDSAVVIKERTQSLRPERKAPPVRVLPEKRSAPPRKKVLIQPLDDEDILLEATNSQDSALPSLTNVKSLHERSRQGPARYTSDGEKSSSSENESSDSDLDQSNIPPEAEKKEEFGLGMPEKKKRRAPIYIHQLAPLFREQEREANKVGLKHAETLIKKKSGWGREVEENAINLTLAILSLQNNYGFKMFEERKKTAMTALVCASPHLVGPCLAEQYFNQQYSMAQRICILNAMAFGARQLSVEGQVETHSTLKTLAEEFSHKAIIRSRVEGERHVPGIERQKSLLVQPKSLDAETKTKRIPNNAYLSLAGPCFIFPLVNRFWAHLDHANATRSSRFRGSGSTILFDSFMVAAFLDTLAVLCYCGQNAVNFSNDIAPEVISLGLTITNTALARAAQGDVTEQGGAPSTILGASSNLFLLILDAVYELDTGRNLLQRHGHLIEEVGTWAEALFESLEGNGGVDRAGRNSAALLLRINEMKRARG